VIAGQGIGAGESLEALRIRQIYNLEPLCPPTHAPEYPPMAAGTRNVRIFLSEQCFGLLVDAMAAYSKQTRRFQTMRMTVQAACSRLKSHGISGCVRQCGVKSGVANGLHFQAALGVICSG
jgi:hypothetical protein